MLEPIIHVRKESIAFKVLNNFPTFLKFHYILTNFNKLAYKLSAKKTRSKQQTM